MLWFCMVCMVCIMIIIHDHKIDNNCMVNCIDIAIAGAFLDLTIFLRLYILVNNKADQRELNLNSLSFGTHIIKEQSS